MAALLLIVPVGLLWVCCQEVCYDKPVHWLVFGHDAAQHALAAAKLGC
jgi:hypothetical protein